MRDGRSSTVLRIAGFYALSFALASLILGAATWMFASRSLRQALDDRMMSELTALLQASSSEGHAALIADIAARDAVPGEGSYLLFDAEGRRVAGRIETRMPRPGLSRVRLRDPAGHFLPGMAATAQLPSGETLAVVYATNSLAEIERTFLLISGGGFALMVTIGVLGGILTGNAIRRRLEVVDLTARAIIEGDLSRRMPAEDRDDEFSRLSRTLNRMLDHIGHLMDSLRHVSEDVAHDLRTPLSRLRARIEIALDGEGEAELRAGLEDSLGRVDEIIALFGMILRIAEVERGGVRDHFGPVPLDLLAANIVEGYEPAALDGGRSIAFRSGSAVNVRGENSLLAQALVNLIENALRHTPQGARITVDTRQDHSGRAVLTVTDDGPGIPAADHELVLRRFGRRDESRSTDGHGLGLTLVAAVATVHGAQFRLDDAAPGLAARIIFPPAV